MRWRSMLFAPANRADRVSKMPRSGADALVIDLEDSVPLDHKAAARDELRDVCAQVVRAGPAQLVLVRVNPATTPFHADDVEAAAACQIDGVVVPKLESRDQVSALRHRLSAHGVSGWVVVAGVETAAGVHRVDDVLVDGVDACYFGAEDYITDVGGRRTDEGTEVLYARSRVALASRIAGVPALDQVVVAFRDDARFAADAAIGRNLGFAGKLCIHPSQVPLANDCFSPSADELAWARRVIDAQQAAATAGVFEVDGQMVDEPLLRRARNLLDDAG